jgi:hypothetical protein
MRLLSAPSSSVSQDWRSPLTSEKSIGYRHSLHMLETSYAMFSVNLDEAIGLRRNGSLTKAYMVLSVTPALCKRLSENVQMLLRAMLSHAKHFGTTPNISPLDPGNFQHAHSRRAAGFNGLCSRLLLTRRSQFLHKISTLVDLVADLEETFSSASSELNDAVSLRPEREWELLDAAHYDLNTCLRESIVLLKCFLLALPDKEVAEFNSALQKQAFAPGATVLTPRRHLAHRRMAPLKGQ